MYARLAATTLVATLFGDTATPAAAAILLPRDTEAVVTLTDTDASSWYEGWRNPT